MKTITTKLTELEYKTLNELGENLKKQKMFLKFTHDEQDKLSNQDKKNLKDFSITTWVREGMETTTIVQTPEEREAYRKDTFTNGYIAGLESSLDLFRKYLQEKYDCEYDFVAFNEILMNSNKEYKK